MQRTFHSRVPWAIVGGLIWLSLLDFPSITLTPQLDHSWQGVLSYASERGLQFGRDVVFTYGPLGYLKNQVYASSGLAERLIWEIFFKGILAALILEIAVRFPKRPRIGFLISVVIASRYPQCDTADTLYLLTMTWLVLLAACGSRRGCGMQNIWLVVAPFILASLALIKFTFLLFAGVNVASLAIHFFSCGRRRAALLVVGSFVLTFLLGWLLAGQGIENLWPYVKFSAEISHGYAYAMGIGARPAVFWLAIVACSLLVASTLCSAFPRAGRANSLGLLLTILAVIFLAWKEGFVRADIHVVYTFTCYWLLAASLPAFFQAPAKLRPVVGWSTFLVIPLCFLGLCFGKPAFAVENVFAVVSRFDDNTTVLLDFPGYRRAME
ncbi:MAG: hypothetical protein EPO07_12840, partial [Verrucomicrobia bacterium]